MAGLLKIISLDLPKVVRKFFQHEVSTTWSCSAGNGDRAHLFNGHNLLQVTSPFPAISSISQQGQVHLVPDNYTQPSSLLLSTLVVRIKLISWLRESHGDNIDVCTWKPTFKLDHCAWDRSAATPEEHCALLQPPPLPAKLERLGCLERLQWTCEKHLKLASCEVLPLSRSLFILSSLPSFPSENSRIYSVMNSYLIDYMPDLILDVEDTLNEISHLWGIYTLFKMHHPQ